MKRGGRRAGRPLLSVPYGAVDGGEDAFEGGQVDVVGNPNAEPVISGLVLEVDMETAWESEPCLMACSL